MTGFIRGLFQPKTQSSEAEKTKVEKTEAKPKERPQPKKLSRAEKVSRAFFLDGTEAGGLGNVEYMKAARKVRRTFPKTIDQLEELELVQEVSALIRTVGGQLSASSSSDVAKSEPSQTSTPTNNEVAERRRTDSSMDMFRKMARDIKK
jgi:hypothetical protein